MLITIEIILLLTPIIAVGLIQHSLVKLKIAKIMLIFGALVFSLSLAIEWLEVILNKNFLAVGNSIIMGNNWWSIILKPLTFVVYLLAYSELDTTSTKENTD